MLRPHAPAQHSLDRRRFDAALAFQQRSFARFTATLGRWSQRHIGYVIDGERKGSAALLAAIQAELGEAAWHYVSGQTDRLADGEYRHAAA